ncbi:hypothetical protein KEM55_006158 [Ascosphaera atra]|nr:hypothetical protein KEM55_006158 [Ascosphaera atra]
MTSSQGSERIPPYVLGRSPGTLDKANAGLLALAATIDLFPEDDCATKVLPAVCPALVDKEKLVRDQAHKTLDAYLTRIRKYNETMADTATPDPVASKADTRIDTSKDSSWAGWAISSFTNRVSLPAGRIEPTANGGLDPQGQPTVAQPPSVPESRVSSPAHGFQSPARRPVTAETPSIASATSKLSLEEPAATANDEFEEWGDMDDGDGDDGWGFDEDKEASAQDRRRQEAASATTRQPPAAPTATARTKTKTTAAASTVSYDDGGEPDFAGWLAAQSKSKASKALPKKTTKTTTASTRLSSSSSRPQTIARSRTEPTAAKQSKIEPKQQSRRDHSPSSSKKATRLASLCRQVL